MSEEHDTLIATPWPVLPDDTLTYRMLLKPKWMTSEGEVTSQAFLLRPADAGCLSVSLRGERTEPQLCEEEPKRFSKCVGVSQTNVEEIRRPIPQWANLLDVVQDAEHHACILGLPPPENAEEETEYVANQLAKRGAACLAKAVGVMMTKINLAEKFALFSEHWNPKIVGELNGQHVKLVKFAGPFVWHHHPNEDELFLVVKGRFRMELQSGTIDLSEGEFLIVPRGVSHRPVAGEEVHVLLFEPAGTLNTGNTENERTVSDPDRL